MFGTGTDLIGTYWNVNDKCLKGQEGINTSMLHTYLGIDFRPSITLNLISWP